MFLGSFGGQYPQYYPPYPYAMPVMDHYHNQFPTGQLPPAPPSFPPKPYPYPQQNYPMRGPLAQGYGNYQNKGRRNYNTGGVRNFVGGKGFPGSPQKMAGTYANVNIFK